MSASVQILQRIVAFLVAFFLSLQPALLTGAPQTVAPERPLSQLLQAATGTGQEPEKPFSSQPVGVPSAPAPDQPEEFGASSPQGIPSGDPSQISFLASAYADASLSGRVPISITDAGFDPRWSPSRSGRRWSGPTAPIRPFTSRAASRSASISRWC